MANNDRLEGLRTCLGERIRRRRMELGWSQDELAERVGSWQPSVSDWECGRRLPSWEKVIDLGVVMDVKLNRLLREPDKEDEECQDRQGPGRKRKEISPIVGGKGS